MYVFVYIDPRRNVDNCPTFASGIKNGEKTEECDEGVEEYKNKLWRTGRGRKIRGLQSRVQGFLKLSLLHLVLISTWLRLL